MVWIIWIRNVVRDLTHANDDNGHVIVMMVLVTVGDRAGWDDVNDVRPM